jgi:hypothetical protein
VTARREGELCLPTTVSVSGRDGERAFEWSCGESLSVTVEAPVAAMIDPELLLPLDLDWHNNGLRLEPDRRAWLAVAARLIRGLQVLFQSGVW